MWGSPFLRRLNASSCRLPSWQDVTAPSPGSPPNDWKPLRRLTQRRAGSPSKRDPGPPRVLTVSSSAAGPSQPDRKLIRGYLNVSAVALLGKPVYVSSSTGEEHQAHRAARQGGWRVGAPGRCTVQFKSLPRWARGVAVADSHWDCDRRRGSPPEMLGGVEAPDRSTRRSRKWWRYLMPPR